MLLEFMIIALHKNSPMKYSPIVGELEDSTSHRLEDAEFGTNFYKSLIWICLTKSMSFIILYEFLLWIDSLKISYKFKMGNTV